MRVVGSHFSFDLFLLCDNGLNHLTAAILILSILTGIILSGTIFFAVVQAEKLFDQEWFRLRVTAHSFPVTLAFPITMMV